VTWTLRRILILIVLLSSCAVAGTLIWVTATYQKFAIENQNALTAATVSHLVRRQIEDKHQRKVHPFIDEWARLSTLVKGMKENNPERARIAANRMMHTLEVAQGRVRLRNVVIYDREMSVVAAAEKGSEESLAGLPPFLDRLQNRDLGGQRKILSLMWRSQEGRPLISTIAPIGGFQVAGFVEFVTDPVPDLDGIETALQGRFSLLDANGDTLFVSSHSDAVPADADQLETLRVPVEGANGEVWAVATLTRDLSGFYASVSVLRDRALGIVAAVVVGSALIGWLLLKLAVFGRLRDFSKAMQVLASGDTKVDVPTVGPDEMQTIRRALLSLRDAVRERREANAELQRARAEAEEQAKLQRIILDNVGQGIVVFQDENRPVLANELAERFTGLPIHLSLSEREIAQTEHYDFDDGVKEQIREFNSRVRAGGLGFVTTYQRRGIDPDTWTQVSLRALEDGMIVQTYQDITDLRKAIETAQQSQYTAEQANQAKSDFLSNMSHELRTPLNAIIGFTEFVMVNEKESISDNQRDSLSQVLKAGRHLLTLIDDILDLAKIEANTVALTIEPVEPLSVIDECVALTASYGDARNISVASRITENPLPSIEVDKTRFKQVLLNLISNGIKYNDVGGTVRIIRAAADNGMLRIGVQDNGPGISAAGIENLFDPFDRLGAENSAIEGTGIGLTITKRLVDQMGGTISVDSQEGRGTTFWLDFPVSEQVVVLPQPEHARMEAPHDADCAGLILYIEDNPANLDLVRKIFSHHPGVRLLDAPTGELGLDRARTDKPDVILIDLDLPGIDGADMLEILKSNPSTAETPVIALTAAATEGERRKGEQAGFFRYLTKPVATAALIESVEQALPAIEPGPDVPQKTPIRA